MKCKIYDINFFIFYFYLYMSGYLHNYSRLLNTPNFTTGLNYLFHPGMLLAMKNPDIAND